MKGVLLKFIKYYLPALFVAGLIFYFSSIPSLRYDTGSVSSEIFFRKAAHFFEYAVLAILIFRIFFIAHNLGLKRSILFAFIFSVSYSISDEIHQGFVAGRSGQFIDVLFDSVSAFIILEIISANKKFYVKKIFLILLGIIILILLGLVMIKEAEIYEEKKVIIINENKTENLEISDSEESYQEESKTIKEDPIVEDDSNAYDIPDKIIIEVPFTTQAPFANWDEYHEEACEEASLIMLKYYLDGKDLNKDIAEKEIQDLIAYEIEKYGDYRDSNAKQIVEIALNYFGINNLEVVYDFEPEAIKEYLAKGNPIIVPAAGRLLGNPNFTAPGPLYHNLILVGYSGDIIVTNDPGTRKGEGFTYSLETLYNAIHDFPGNKEKIEQGQKAMIVIK